MKALYNDNAPAKDPSVRYDDLMEGTPFLFANFDVNKRLVRNRDFIYIKISDTQFVRVCSDGEVTEPYEIESTVKVYSFRWGDVTLYLER